MYNSCRNIILIHCIIVSINYNIFNGKVNNKNSIVHQQIDLMADGRIVIEIKYYLKLL